MALVTRWSTLGCACLLWIGGERVSSAAPTLEQALALKPVQDGVQFDSPEEKERADCTFKNEKIGKLPAWVVRDRSGQIMRVFVDTDGNKTVDQWRYFKDGIEVYRDIDSDANQTADQFRWLNTAGSRWGIDKNEDRIIDSWQQISAEEVTSEAIAAMAAGDAARFARLLPTAEEIDSLGLGEEKTDEVRQKVAKAVEQFKDIAKKQKIVGAQTEWVHFGGSLPSLVPAGTDGSTKDVLVYDNVVAMIETSGQPGQAPVGTIVRVGDSWRLIDAPQLAGESGANPSLFAFNPARNDTASEEGAEGQAEYERLAADLQKASEQVEQAGAGANAAKLRQQRSELFDKVIAAAPSPQDRGMWLRNLADTLMADAQTGNAPEGVEQLLALHAKLVEANDPETAAYVEFRRLTAKYNLDMQNPKANFATIQTTWLEDLRTFVEKNPESADAAEAMLQIALAEEFAGQEDEAKTWYGEIAKKFPESPAAAKARGATVRLDCIGKEIKLHGPSPDGKVVDLAQFRKKAVIIQYWATNCEPCIADFEQLRELQAKYQKKGLAIVGVSLDGNKKELDAFLKKNKLPWVQVYEPGGLDSRLANEMGILSLPTMILVDRQGKVVNRNVHIDELDKELKALLP